MAVISAQRKHKARTAENSFGWLKTKAFLYGGLISLGIFFLLPFTQLLSGLGKKETKVRSFDLVQPPPPPPPEIDEAEEEPPPEEPPPELTPPPPPMNLAQLELALTPGIGEALADGVGFGGFDLSPDAAMDLQLFDVKDLDELPRPIKQVKMQPPTRFKQERLSGLVKLEIMIDEEGNTSVIRIHDSSDHELDEPAREALIQWRWTPPRKNGEAVKARYILPIGFSY